MGLKYTGYAEIRAALLDRLEIALLDVREEHLHAQGHPLFAANLSLSRLELEAFSRIPRLDAPVVTLDGGEEEDEGRAERAAAQLQALGYTNVSVLEGGLKGWQAAGGEVFRDVNAPSKAFGELVDATLHPPMLEPASVKAMIDGDEDAVFLDVRRFDEYQTMSIPRAINVPGAELVRDAPTLAPEPRTPIVVNCAGRTRSIIAAQSLINAGLPNPVAALENGTIGWTLAGLGLEHGQSRRRTEPVPDTTRQLASERARSLAQRAGARWVTLDDIEAWRQQQDRSTYFIDVRDPDRYAAGHLPGFRSVPGGQLVQETEMSAAVRGARIVLADTDGIEAPMTASWLAQMAWEVYVLTPPPQAAWHETGAWQAPRPPFPTGPRISPAQLAKWQAASEPPVIIDLTTFASYRTAHIPGAIWALRAEITTGALERIPSASRYVLTCLSGALGYYAQAEVADWLAKHGGGEIHVLEGGTNAWKAAGLPLVSGEEEKQLASEPVDRYRRPYEGTDVGPEAMQAYLDWEFGLVAQLERDGTHHFRVLG
jgi:rhodanese-related sulfurtransferase